MHQQNFLLSALSKRGNIKFVVGKYWSAVWHEIIIFQFGALSALRISRSRSQRNFNVFFLSAAGGRARHALIIECGTRKREMGIYAPTRTEHLRVCRRLQVAQLFHQQKVNALLANPLGPRKANERKRAKKLTTEIFMVSARSHLILRSSCGRAQNSVGWGFCCAFTLWMNIGRSISPSRDLILTLWLQSW